MMRSVIGKALRSAGIAHTRCHSLRHTLACRMVNSGSCIKEVADVLRLRYWAAIQRAMTGQCSLRVRAPMNSPMWPPGTVFWTI
jgi:integrase